MSGKSSKLRPQNISISDDCVTRGGIQHEIAHSLGILHEMSRRDRDKYIKILKKNIASYAYTNFVIYDNFKTNSYGIKFNYGSGMLYDRFAGSKNFKPATLAKKKYYSRTMGQIFDLAFTDIKLLNYHYCNQTCETKLDCENNGYTNPNNCFACQCPNFFTGKLCNEIWPSPPSCGRIKLNATSRYKKLYVYGRKKCLYEIVSPANKRIKLKIQYASLTKIDPCQRNNGLEIKYLTDKSVSGAMFCGVYRNAIIRTLSNKVYVYYVGLQKYHRVRMIYKSINNKKKH
uniref:Metalloendopeptidase n=1 Tax=Strongyloides papillosus TaxID=174720 RepID=A0A0N5CCJ3_STREA